VNAALDGDTLLIWPVAGDYDEVVIDGKGLHLTTDFTTVVVKNGIIVRNLPEGSNLTIQGLEMGIHLNSDWYDYETLFLEGNQGSIRVEDCTVVGPAGWEEFIWPSWYVHYAEGAVFAKECTDVAMIHCDFKGGNGLSGSWIGSVEPGRSAIEVIYSDIALYDCIMVGGDGGDGGVEKYGGEGGDGCTGWDYTLFASGCRFEGGDGGEGDYSGGSGGHGLDLFSSNSEARLLDNVYEGGEGGYAPMWPGSPGKGTNGSGTFTYLSGTAHSFETPSPVRLNEASTFTFEGQHNDLYGILLSSHADSKFMAGFKGQLLVGTKPMPFLFILGTLPPSGTVTMPITIPNQGPGFTGHTVYIQSIFNSASEGVTLGPLSPVIVLAEIY
jgi:hypothetical protein